MRILVIGADGQLGTELVEVLAAAGHEVDASVIADLDITQAAAVHDRLRSTRPAVVINTAAYHHVDRCESTDELCFRVNAIAVRTLAEGCEQAKAALVQLSTDYVFDGAKCAPYVEDDLPRPQSAYAISKLSGEHYARYTERCYIVRTSGLYGRVPSVVKGYNFIEKVLQLAGEKDEVPVVDDEILTPTYALDLARNIALLVETGVYGTYHITNNGSCSWYEFAREAYRLAEIATPLRPIPASTWASPARRPGYSVLDNRNLRRLGLDRMRPWQEALADYLRSTGRLPAGSGR